MKNNKSVCTRFIALFMLFAFTAVGGVAQAQESKGISVAGKVSTLGLGLELKYPLHDKFNGRLALNQYDKSWNKTKSGINYTGDLELGTYGLIGDWHPADNGFRLSVGVFSNGNKITARAAQQQFTLRNHAYTGKLNVQAEFKSLVPYLGLGWSSRKKSGLSFDFEVGALFQGTPMLSANGTAGTNNINCNFTVNTSGTAAVTGDNCANAQTTARVNLKDDLEAEYRELAEDLDDFKLYPVLSFGIQYRF